MSRTGRRPGSPGTREEILAVARRMFATSGYEATSLRAIGAEADVDPALLIHYYGSKQGLFSAAAGLPPGLTELLGGLARLELPEFARALVSMYLQFIDSDSSRNAILALVRSAVSNEAAAAMLRDLLTVELLGVVVRFTSHEDARLRASLVAAQLVGIAMIRHVVRADPLATASPADITALVAPVIELYLGREPLSAPAPGSGRM